MTQRGERHGGALRRGCRFSAGDEVFGAVPPMRGSFADLVSVPLDQAGELQVSDRTRLALQEIVAVNKNGRATYPLITGVLMWRNSK